MVAESVPNGIDFRGFFKSPDKPTPAVIPVNAGKMMANTIKKSSGFLIVAKISTDSGGDEDLPTKNMSNDMAKMDTTNHKAVTPIFAPFVSMIIKRMIVAGILIIHIFGTIPI